MWSYEREDVLVGASCKNPRLVTEMQAPAQDTAPVSVPVVVVMDNPGKTQRHVTEEGRVLHHVGISCRSLERENRTSVFIRNSCDEFQNTEQRVIREKSEIPAIHTDVRPRL